MKHRNVEALMPPADLVVSVRPDMPYKVVAELLSVHSISGMPVLGPTGRVIGVVTESDLLAKEIQANGPVAGRTSRHRAPSVDPGKAKAVTAMDLMTSPAITAAPHEGAATAAHAPCPVVVIGVDVPFETHPEIVLGLAKDEDPAPIDFAFRVADLLGLSIRAVRAFEPQIA